MTDSTRIYVTGSCDGLDRLRDALADHPELDFVGWSEHVAEASPALAGGHLQVVVHATRSASFPAHEVAAIREHTRSPIVILASATCSLHPTKSRSGWVARPSRSRSSPSHEPVT